MVARSPPARRAHPTLLAPSPPPRTLAQHALLPTHPLTHASARPPAPPGLLGLFNRIGDRLLHFSHLARSNTVVGSRRNIEEHYDAGEAELWHEAELWRAAALPAPTPSLRTHTRSHSRPLLRLPSSCHPV